MRMTGRAMKPEEGSEESAWRTFAVTIAAAQHTGLVVTFAHIPSGSSGPLIGPLVPRSCALDLSFAIS